MSIKELREKYSLSDQPKFNLQSVKKQFKKLDIEKIQTYSHKPFLNRFVYYDSLLLRRHSDRVMNQFFNRTDNHMLLLKKRFLDDCYHHCFYTNKMTDRNFLSGQTYCFPLYLYDNETSSQTSLYTKKTRTPNLNPEIVKQIAEGLGIAFVSEKEHTPNPSQEGNKTFAPIDLLDYIYAVLHSPSYREKYKEFLKIDFPRVPYPTSLSKFQTLTKLGSELRQIHLLESPVVEDFITQYPEDGTNIVGKLYYEKTTETLGRVYINHDKTPPSGVGGLQYFENVPEVAWNFYIGGYQPAQKWLKDRKERELSYEDILHYQKIIVALSETDRIMKEIDTIEI